MQKQLGINIDHIATLREARKINDPDPLEAVFIAKRAGADQITVHLREDRRHMHDSDIKRILESSFLPLNVECSINEEITDYLLHLKPHRVTFVPENRAEITTEGGLDILKYFDRILNLREKFNKNGVEVSLFIDADINQINASKDLKAQFIELHTGLYANLHLMLYSNLPHTHNCITELNLPKEILKEKLQESLQALQKGAKVAHNLGLQVAAGHGLNYINIQDILNIQEITELNIGQSIIARAIFSSLEKAIKDMVEIVK